MHATGSHSSFLLVSVTFFVASLVPEVPPIAQWVCLILSALASVVTIIKQLKR